MLGKYSKCIYPCLIYLSLANFSNEPEDVFVTEGESAFFNCTHDGGVTNILTWIINEQSYSNYSFPSRHYGYQSGQLLEVVNTTVSDNESTYQCILQHQESKVAVLTVSELEQGS